MRENIIILSPKYIKNAWSLLFNKTFLLSQVGKNDGFQIQSSTHSSTKIWYHHNSSLSLLININIDLITKVWLVNNSKESYLAYILFSWKKN
jgi:hypothetical protein